MTNIRIADGDSREDFILVNERELYRRVCVATASDMGAEANSSGVNVSANPFRLHTAEYRAWRDAWINRSLERSRLADAEQACDLAEPQRTAPLWSLVKSLVLWPLSVLWAVISWKEH